MARRFGWHSGTVHASNVIVENDLTISGNLNFGNASTDTLTVNGAAIFNSNVTMVLDSAELMSISHSNGTENQKAVNISLSPVDLTHGVRQGALFIGMDRTATYALTGWDGNPDCGLKIQVFNRAVSGANGGSRGIDVIARNRDTGTESWINAIYATAENSANTIASAYTGQFIMKNNGVVSSSLYGVVIQDTSQGSNPTDTVSLKLTTGTIAPATGIRNMAMQITSADSIGYTNGISFGGPVTNVLDFAAVDGTNGFKVAVFTNNVVTANPDAYVKIDGNGTPYFVPAYVTPPA